MYPYIFLVNSITAKFFEVDNLPILSNKICRVQSLAIDNQAVKLADTQSDGCSLDSTQPRSSSPTPSTQMAGAFFKILTFIYVFLLMHVKDERNWPRIGHCVL